LVNWPYARGQTVYGGSTDTWDVVLSPADVNASNFGVGITAGAANGNGRFNAEIDLVEVIVHTCE